ncbi:MAG TPA: phosphoglycolate phosphatase [Gammaproteobacteria bacterium]|nr:phosphoglycolate phosphatase [Gammaproteobacteria bacterium]
MPTHPLQLAIFDLDGTLVDSAADIAMALDSALGSVGLGPVGVVRVREWVGGGLRLLIERALAHHFGGTVWPGAMQARLEQAFDLNYASGSGRSAQLFPGTEQALEALRARDVLLACVTNKPIRHTLPLLQRLGLGESFRLVLGGDSLPLAKPHGLPLQVATIRLGVPPVGACMIGDSMNDLAAAHAAGIAAIAVSHGYAQGADLGAHAAAVIDSMTELLPTLRQLGRLA